MHHITCCFLLRFSARVCSIKITFSHMRERSLRAFFSVHSTEMLPMWKKKIINLGCLRPWTSITLFFNTAIVAAAKLCGLIYSHNMLQLWRSGHFKSSFSQLKPDNLMYLYNGINLIVLFCDTYNPHRHISTFIYSRFDRVKWKDCVATYTLCQQAFGGLVCITSENKYPLNFLQVNVTSSNIQQFKIQIQFMSHLRSWNNLI